MTKPKCKCPPDSPFHWKHDQRPSIFLRDPHIKAAATISHNQTMVIERAREQGKDLSHLPGLSEKVAKMPTRISVKEFNIFSRAGAKL